MAGPRRSCSHASGSLWQAGHTARQFASGSKEFAVPAEPFKKLDVRWSVFGRGHSRKPLPNIGSMVVECALGERLDRQIIGGVFMKSLIFKRSIMVAGHKTSVSLEDAFWNGLKEIARERHMRLSGVSRRNRRSAATRQSVVGPSTFRARFLSHPTFPRKGRARPNSRHDRLHCARFFLSLCGQPSQSVVYR